jgi:hypothetical protein
MMRFVFLNTRSLGRRQGVESVSKDHGGESKAILPCALGKIDASQAA